MNKAELIEVLTKELDTDRRSATDAVEHFVNAIVRAVHKGESVTITGFGVFERRRRDLDQRRHRGRDIRRLGIGRRRIAAWDLVSVLVLQQIR